jgi:hypothetical protein
LPLNNGIAFSVNVKQPAFGVQILPLQKIIIRIDREKTSNPARSKSNTGGFDTKKPDRRTNAGVS